MFRLDKGKYCGEHISFIPPDGFNIDVRRKEFDKNGFKFVSLDGSVVIKICFETYACPSEEQIETVVKENDFCKLSGLYRVKRGRGNGVGVYCGRFANSAEMYVELHDFKTNDFMENQVSVAVQAVGWRRRSTNPIYEVLGMPTVKAFWDSIEYFG